MYKLVIFDLDGTLADTSEGIYQSHRHALEAMGRSLQEDMLNGVIGGELLVIYRDRFGFNEGEAREAVRIYREWYQQHGIFQATLYAGMKETLIDLKNRGCRLAVATLKREDFAKQMLERMGVAECFDWIYGMDIGDTLNKQLLLMKCMAAADVTAKETVLVGDSENDAKGAKACEMDFIAVTYGFGFSPERDVPTNVAVATVHDTTELNALLKGSN